MSPLQSARLLKLHPSTTAAILTVALAWSADASGPASVATRSTVAQVGERRFEMARRYLSALERNPYEQTLQSRLFALFESDAAELLQMLDDPTDDPVRRGARAYLLGKAFARAGDHARAVEAFSTASKLLPPSPVLQADLARSLRETGDLDAERSALEQGIASGVSQTTPSNAITEMAFRLAGIRLEDKTADPNANPNANPADPLASLPPATWSNATLVRQAIDLFSAAGRREEILAMFHAMLLPTSGLQDREAAVAISEVLLDAFAADESPVRFLATADFLTRQAAPGSAQSLRFIRASIYAARSAGKLDALLESWRAAFAASPADPSVALRLAQLARLNPGSDTHQLERDSLSAYLTSNPLDRHATARLAEIEIELGETEAAIQRLSSLADGRPGDSGLVFQLARALLAAGRDEDAASRIFALLKSTPDDSSLRRRALNFFNENRLWSHAEKLLRQTALPDGKAADDSGTALIELADFLIARGRANEVPNVLSLLVRADDPPERRAEQTLRVATLLADRQLYNPARERLQEALTLRPDDPAIRLRLSDIELALGNTGRARLELVAAGEAAARSDLANSTPESRTLLEQADKKLFALLLRLSEPADAGQNDGWMKIDLPGLGPVPLRPLPPGARAIPREILRVAEDLDRRARESSSPALWRRAGSWRALFRDGAGASAAFENGARLAEAAPEKIDLLSRAADAALESGAHDRAAQILRSALAIATQLGSGFDPNPLRVRLAKALGAAGKIGEACEIIEEAVHAGAKLDFALPALALIQQTAGYHADALLSWQRLIESTPPGTRQRLDAIKNSIRSAEQLGKSDQTAGLLFDEMLRATDERLRKEIFGELAGLAERARLGRWLEEKIAAALKSSPGDQFLLEALDSVQKTTATATRQPRGKSAEHSRAPSSLSFDEAVNALDPDAALAAAAAAFADAGVAGLDDIEPGMQLARLQADLLDFNAAIETLSRLGRRHPRNPAPRLALADLYRRLRNPAAELEQVEACLKIAADDISLPARAGRLREKLGDSAGAADSFLLCTDLWLRKNPPDPPARTATRPPAPGQKTAMVATPSTPEEFLFPPPSSSLMARLPAYVTAGEERVFPEQIALAQALRELHRRAPSTAPDSARSAVLHAAGRAAALLSQSGSQQAPALDKLLENLSASGDAALWWHALRACGRDNIALDLLETRCRLESDPPALRFAFLKAALDARAFDRIKEWLETRGRGNQARSFIRLALVIEAAERGSVADGLLDALLSAGDLPRQFLAQTADLLARLSLPSSALRVLQQLGPDGVVPPPQGFAPSPEEAARWNVASDRTQDALGLLDRVQPDNSIAALSASRLRWLLTPPQKRHLLLISETERDDPLRRFLFEALESEVGSDGTPSGGLILDRPAGRFHANPALARLNAEERLDLALQLKAWGLRRTASSLLSTSLDNPGIFRGDGSPSRLLFEQMRILATAWQFESGDHPSSSPQGSFTPLGAESGEFLHGLVGVLESSNLPFAAAEVYGELARLTPATEQRDLYLRSQIAMLRASGRLSDAAALLHSLLKERSAPRTGRASNASLPGYLSEQSIALAAELTAANAAAHAAALLDQAEALFSGDPALRKARADHLRALGRFSEAFDLYARLARQSPASSDLVALAVQTSIDAREPSKGAALLESLPPLASASETARMRTALALAQNQILPALEHKSDLLAEEAGAGLAPLIHELVKSGKTGAAALMIRWAERAGADALSLLNLRSTLALALAERGALPVPTVCFLCSSICDAALPLGSRGQLLAFSMLSEFLFRLPPGEGSEPVEAQLVEMSDSDPADMPLERLVEIAWRTGRESLLAKLIDRLESDPRVSEQSLLLAASSLQAGGRHADALRIASRLAARFPMQPTPHLMAAFSESILSGKPPGDRFQRALDLAVFDPDGFGRAALLLTDLGRRREALPLFSIWESLTVERSPSIAAVAATTRILESPGREPAADVLRRYMNSAILPSDLSPVAAFRKKFAPRATAADLIRQFHLQPHLENQIALGIFLDLSKTADPAVLLSFLKDHPGLFHIPARPMKEFERLARSPRQARLFRDLLAEAAKRDPALPLKTLLESL